MRFGRSGYLHRIAGRYGQRVIGNHDVAAVLSRKGFCNVLPNPRDAEQMSIAFLFKLDRHRFNTQQLTNQTRKYRRVAAHFTAEYLGKCRSPLGFLMTEWREGTNGALVMGVRHGVYCVGCCWALMLILFGVGVMNMLWVMLITAFVLIEKVLPAPGFMRITSGLGLICWGGVLAKPVLQVMRDTKPEKP